MKRSIQSAAWPNGQAQSESMIDSIAPYKTSQASQYSREPKNLPDVWNIHSSSKGLSYIPQGFPFPCL